MDISGIIAELEARLAAQLDVAGTDPAVDAAASALLAVLEPSVRQAALGIVEAAAAEMDAQLPDGHIDVVLREGEPSLQYRSADRPEPAYSSEDLHARLTLRLPEALKAQLEEAAGTVGDSLNAYVVKNLAEKRVGRRGKRISGVIET